MGILASVAVASITASAALVPSASASVGSLVSFEQAAHTVSVAQYYQYINVEAVQVEGRRIFEYISVGDQVALTVEKVLSDSVTATDVIGSIDETEVVADSLGAVDVATIQFDAVRGFSEAVLAADSLSIVVPPNGLVDGDVFNARELNG